jgi:hypothetical protein
MEVVSAGGAIWGVARGAVCFPDGKEGASISTGDEFVAPQAEQEARMARDVQVFRFRFERTSLVVVSSEPHRVHEHCE